MTCTFTPAQVEIIEDALAEFTENNSSLSEQNLADIEAVLDLLGGETRKAVKKALEKQFGDKS